MARLIDLTFPFGINNAICGDLCYINTLKYVRTCIGYEYVTDKFVNEGAEEQTPI